MVTETAATGAHDTHEKLTPKQKRYMEYGGGAAGAIILALYLHSRATSSSPTSSTLASSTIPANDAGSGGTSTDVDTQLGLLEGDFADLETQLSALQGSLPSSPTGPSTTGTPDPATPEPAPAPAPAPAAASPVPVPSSPTPAAGPPASTSISTPEPAPAQTAVPLRRSAVQAISTGLSTGSGSSISQAIPYLEGSGYAGTPYVAPDFVAPVAYSPPPPPAPHPTPAPPKLSSLSPSAQAAVNKGAATGSGSSASQVLDALRFM